MLISWILNSLSLLFTVTNQRVYQFTDNFLDHEIKHFSLHFRHSRLKSNWFQFFTRLTFFHSFILFVRIRLSIIPGQFIDFFFCNGYFIRWILATICKFAYLIRIPRGSLESATSCLFYYWGKIFTSKPHFAIVCTAIFCVKI